MKNIVIRLIFALALVLSLVGVAGAITNGQPDGNNHPYVGMALGPATGGGYWVCTAAAISPTVLVTAAHCFEGPDVWVTFVEVPEGTADLFQYAGTWTPDPDFCYGCGAGLSGLDSHDVAVIVLNEPVSLPGYAMLPAATGLVDTLPMKTDVDLAGYGLQFDNGGGPRYPEDGAFTRYYAPSQLIASHHVNSDEFITLTANPAQGKGGACFGDAGGPVLLGGTDIILAVNVYQRNSNCAGVTNANRIDTYALDFINSFLP